MSDRHVFNLCALIPIYNHYLVVESTVARLLGHGLPVILVDDGSDEYCKQVIAAIVEKHKDVSLISQYKNRGKGRALKDGFYAAKSRGFSHAIQIDADGQHDHNDIDRFISNAKANPKALVCGYPVFDESVPKHRFYGRYASHIWVWINTLSTEIKDSMCGFRVYPLYASCNLLEQCETGDHMEFEGEFIVRWYWQAYPLKQLATKVTYPEDGVSQFRLGRDNLLISWMHTRLFFGMLLRAPRLLRQKYQLELENEN